MQRRVHTNTSLDITLNMHCCRGCPTDNNPAQLEESMICERHSVTYPRKHHDGIKQKG